MTLVTLTENTHETYFLHNVHNTGLLRVRLERYYLLRIKPLPFDFVFTPFSLLLLDLFLADFNGIVLYTCTTTTTVTLT